MAKELQPIERSLSTPSIDVGSNTAYAQMGEVTGKLAQLLAGQLSNQAVYQSQEAGKLAALEGRAPKELAFPLTKATAAYNEAVTKIEARKLINTGRSELLNAFAEMQDESKFNEQTPALFKARVEGITQGILDTARPQNRAEVQAGLQELAMRTEFQMLNKAIEYDNKQTMASFKQDLEAAQKAEIDARLNKDPVALKIAKENVEFIYRDYANLSQDIKNKIPELKAKYDEELLIADKVGDYLVALDLGEGQKFLTEFTLNKNTGLTIEQKFTALNKMLSVRNQVDSADNERMALAKQKIDNDIINQDSPTRITSFEDLYDREAYKILSPLQKEQVSTTLIQALQKDNSKQEKVANAYKEIGLGRAGAVDKSVINDIFVDTRNQIEQEIGRPMSLAEQFEIIKNKTQTHVPKFDQLVSSMLTSLDPAQTLEAGQFLSTVNITDQENLINLSGDHAKVMGEKLSRLLNGVNLKPEEVVDQTIKTVMKASDADVAGRNKLATAIISAKGPSIYKDIFNKKHDPFMDHGAYNVFKDQFMNSIAAGANEDEAIRITKRAMRGWGSSTWFENNEVNQAAPENELVLSKGTYNIRNQIVTALNYIVKANNDTVTPKSGKYKMKLFGPPVPDKYNAADYIFKPLGYKDIEPTVSGSMIDPVYKLEEIYPSTDAKIFIEVNGVKTDVKLKASTQTRAVEDGLVYGLFAKDKEGVYQQLPNPKSPDGLAYIVLKDLDKIAPEVFQNQNNEQLKGVLRKARSRQIQASVGFELRRALTENPMKPEPKFLDFDVMDTSIEELKKALKENE